MELSDLLRGQFTQPVRLEQEWLAIAHEEKLGALMRELLGDEALRMHYPPMSRFKYPGQSQANVPLHPDYVYFKNLQSNFINTWIPLCPITEECGGINILEGSHVSGPLEHRPQGIWGSFVDPKSVPGRFPDRHFLMEPGDVLAFGPHMLHYTHPNTSQKVRFSVDCRWFAASTESTKQYFDLTTKSIVKMY